MGVLIDGSWHDEEFVDEIRRSGEFVRSESTFREWITSDGSSGLPAEAGRYHLYAAPGCPWSHRVLIFRVLKKLQNAVTVTLALPVMREQGWTFEDSFKFPDCGRDQVNGFHHLHQAYTATDPHFSGKVTVPALWDRKTGRIINNESSDIIRMFNSAFAGIAGDDTDFYQPLLRAEIDRINDQVHRTVNEGVYRCGLARSQAAYDTAYEALFETLEEFDARLGRQRYLLGRHLTEADWRLFPTLVRFDVAYHPLFKCNKRRIADFPNLVNYMRELYQVPGIAATVKPRYYVLSYWSQRRLNPTGIIPKGTPVDFSVEHDRWRVAA
jgi:glutathionyl-hydroquinone reductase